MGWLPADYDGSCTGSTINQSVPLTLVCFLIQYFGDSNDDILKDIYTDQSLNEIDYDFIVIGAGAAGCVVANRLSEESNWKVLLLEAGDEEPRLADVPGLQGHLSNSNLNYGYRTNDTKPLSYYRGKVMGGSTTINGMVYARGAKADYDDWATMGNDGWNWDNILPYFKKLETARDSKILANFPEYHGISGYLVVDQFPVEDEHTSLYIEAFKEAGLEEKIDYNTGDQIGVSRMQFTSLHGTRLSANGAFIRPIRGKRSNLVVRPKARVTKIIINSVKKSATGVEYELTDVDGSIRKMKANAAKEVIVSAGFIDSPKLLMLSGIGPKDDLQRLNITVIEDLAVGRNLHDHYLVHLSLVSNNSVSTRSDAMTKKLLHEWINTHEGPMSTRHGVSICAYHQSKFENCSGAADLQYELWGLATQVDGTLGNVSIITVLVRPESQGSIQLNAVDPVNSQPDIRVNPLADPQDVEVLVEGLKFTIRMANSSVMKNAGMRLVALKACENYDIESDDYLRCLVENNASHNGHGSGTCKMGPKSDRAAVVDPQLKVHGVSGLRVIDASIMPRVIRANTMAPTMMIAEKGSDMIKNDWL